MVHAHRKSHRISCLLGNQIPKQNKQAIFILAQGNPHKLYFIQLILLPPIQCSSLGLLLFRLSLKTLKQKYPNLLNWGHRRCIISSLSFWHPLTWLLQILALPRHRDFRNFYLSWTKMTLRAHWTWWRNAPSVQQFQFSQPHWSQTLVLPFKESISEHQIA